MSNQASRTSESSALIVVYGFVTAVFLLLFVGSVYLCAWAVLGSPAPEASYVTARADR